MPQRCEITVVIPAYNRARLIGRAVESALDQTVQPAQIIVVDDGSTDDTSEVCQAYSRSVQYARQKNSGASAARNAGIRLASQPWIAFLDSDDYFTPSHLERMRTAISETAGKALFYFSDLQLPESEGGGTLWEATGFRPNAPFHLTNDASPWVLFKRQPTMLQSCVIGKRALESVGGLDESRTVGEDSYLFCQLGIGGIACAVSGIGCVQTSDDLSNVRLTVDNPQGSEKYLAEQCSRWRDVLSWKRLPSEYSRLIAYNLAGAHFGLGKVMWRSGRRVEAMSHFLLGSQADPQLAAWLIRNRSSKAYEETVRPR
jgi:glycosyltransferase involved in cell wall biosynthesis